MKEKKDVKKVIMITIALIASVFVYQMFRLNNTSQRSNDFVVGMTGGYAPWVSLNPQGQYEGFDIDVAQAIAKQMGKTLILKDLGSMASLFAGLESGMIDAIIWGISITQDRLQKVAMVNYQGERVSSYPLLFWNNIPEKIKSINDMLYNIVCVEPASSQEAVLLKYGFTTPLAVDKVDDALLNIKYGKADAALVEPAIAKKFKNKYPEIQILDVALDPEDIVEGVGVVIRKNNIDLIKQVSEAVTVLKAAGVIANLEQKWDMLP